MYIYVYIKSDLMYDVLISLKFLAPGTGRELKNVKVLRF